jgi:hypothetical protein
MVGTDLKASLAKAVDAALAETDPSKADEKYMEVLQIVRMQVGDNETDMANAMQAVAKDLEDQGRKQQAFDFKQKTCIMLLEFTMMPLPPLPDNIVLSTGPALEEPLLKQVMTIHYVDDKDLAKKHYAKILQAIIIDENESSVCLRTIHGTMIVLAQGHSHEQIPVYESNKKDPGSTLEGLGWTADVSHQATPGGKAQLFTHPKLGKLALIC